MSHLETALTSKGRRCRLDRLREVEKQCIEGSIDKIEIYSSKLQAPSISPWNNKRGMDLLPK